jgi:PH domain
MLWKRRFFMLRGSTFSYFADHNTLHMSKGELIVFAETTISTGELSGQRYCITLADPFPSLTLACETPAEMDIWLKAFTSSIALARDGGVRGFAYKFTSPKEGGGSSKKYFVLHQDAITVHKDADVAAAVLGLIHLNDYTFMEYYDSSKKITIVDTYLKHSLTMVFDVDEKVEPGSGTYIQWKEALMGNLRLYSALVQNAELCLNTRQGLPNMIKKGYLKMRPPKGGEVWPEELFFLNEALMVVVDKDAEDETQARIVSDYAITPNCSVFETNLGVNTFELVTAQRVLHVQATSRDDLISWVEAIKEAIARSYLDTSDPLFQHAILKIDDDYFYDVTFHEKRSLGVVFERTGEWAVIKSSNEAHVSGIQVGSVLTKINGRSIILEKYQDTIEVLKGWQPPLTLTFRKAPTKSGFLLKESKSRSNPAKKVWKKRYFVLGEGRIVYKDAPDINGRIKGDCPLMGSVVSLVHESEAGKSNCFRIMSGMMYLTLQCANQKQVSLLKFLFLTA